MNEKDFESLLKSVNEAGQILRGELKPTRAIQIKVSKLPSAKREGFALCLKSDEPDLLVPMKVYRVKFSSNGYIGVIDEEGEAAFYPPEFFIKLDFSSEVENVLENLQKAA